jgi:(p)ppGpp synthase/HD superfamily hydrolase
MQILNVLREYKLNTENELFMDIGIGNRIAPLIARKLTAGEKRTEEPARNGSETAKPFAIRGTEGMVVNFPKCCYPIPGDPIIGLASAGRGIVIHNQSCKNIAEFRKQPEKWIDVEWEQQIDRDFPARVRMNAINQRGVLATVASAIADQDANILNVDIKDKDDRFTTLEFVIEVRNRQHLAHVMRRIRGIKHVSQLSRR